MEYCTVVFSKTDRNFKINKKCLWMLRNVHKVLRLTSGHPDETSTRTLLSSTR